MICWSRLKIHNKVLFSWLIRFLFCLKEYDAQTQFFVMHDYDNNTKLDGLELLKSMTHFHDEHEGEGEHKEEKKEEGFSTKFFSQINLFVSY